MKFICINLWENKTRRIFMRKQLDNQKINHSFFKAFNGKKMTVDEFYEKGFINEDIFNSFKKGKIKIHKPSFACAFSHLQVWKDFLEEESDEETLLVFEDDFQLKPKFIEKLNEYMNNTPNDWDFLYFDYNVFVGKKLNKYWGIPKNNAGSGNNAYLSCYVINKSGCKKLLDLMYPYNKNLCIDSIMRRNFDKFNAYFSSERLGRQNKTLKSDRTQ